MASMMSADDKLAVIQLIADYGLRLDTGDVEGYVNNFAPDGVFEGTRMRYEGRDAIRGFIRNHFETGQAGPKSPQKLHHFLGVPSIIGDSQRCNARTYVMIPGQDAAGQAFIPLFRTYIDEMIKIDGRWHFAKRTLRNDLI